MFGYFSAMIANKSDPSAAEAIKAGQKLPLMEHFHTIQGEGHHTGRAAYFIRIGGCDVGCHWCDVKESWDASRHPLTEIEKILSYAAESGSRTIVITGGEPLMYELGPLTSKLKAIGMAIHLETSGAYPLSGHFDWICLSPKKTSPPLTEVYGEADELKVIVHNASDLAWAERHAALVSDRCELYLQPEWSKSKDMMPLIVDYVMAHPRWKVSLQSHKYMGIP